MARAGAGAVAARQRRSPPWRALTGRLLTAGRTLTAGRGPAAGRAPLTWRARGRRGLAAAGLLAVTATGLAGCVSAAAASPSIQVATAFVPVPHIPGTTVAYVVIRNNGGADRLLSARFSVGGHVTFRVPAGPGGSGLRVLPTVPVPARSTLAMVPDGLHMVITGAGPMRGGKDITITLMFARAGPVTVIAQVTNPATGGSSYFLN